MCPMLDKSKYLLPLDVSVSQLIYILQKRINTLSVQGPSMLATNSIFLFRQNYLLKGNENIHEIYLKHREPDGFLYLTYDKENVFGC